MENIFSSLNGLTETWLTFGSAPYHKYLSYILLSGLGLLLLYISSLIVRLLARSLQRKKYTPEVRKCGEFPRESLHCWAVVVLSGCGMGLAVRGMSEMNE